MLGSLDTAVVECRSHDVVWYGVCVDRFLTSGEAGLPQQLQTIGRLITVVGDRLTDVAFLLGVVGVENAPDRGVPGPIDMGERSVAAYATAPQLRTPGLPPSSLVASSNAVDPTLASVLHLHGEGRQRCRSQFSLLKFRSPWRYRIASKMCISAAL